MDKTKDYMIINATTHIGEVSDSAKHRIGRTGKFLRLIKGMRFEFFSPDIDKCVHSSRVEAIIELGDVVEVHTLNTIYTFEEVKDENR